MLSAADGCWEDVLAGLALCAGFLVKRWAAGAAVCFLSTCLSIARGSANLVFWAEELWELTDPGDLVGTSALLSTASSEAL